MKPIYCILFICTALLFAGCAKETEDVVSDANDRDLLVFGANKNRIVTRSGDEAERFADGTKYDLYALDVASATPWLTGQALSNTEGVEIYAKDEISYGGGIKESYNDRTLDIYAVTLGTADNPGKSEGGVTYTSATPVAGPKYELKTDASLPGIPDLMRVKHAGATAGSGKIELEFRHVLSKLTFEVVKQDESGDATDLHKLDNVYVASIRLTNARTNGTLDLASGTFENLAGAADRMFFQTTSTPWTVPHITPQLLTSAADGKNGTVPREIYIFPNTAADGKTYLPGEQNNPLGIEVRLKKTDDSSYDKTLTLPLYETASKNPATTDAFRFKANHEYRLTITVLRDNVRIITISPMVYDWIPGFVEGEKDIDYLGQPVTFGNLMWMDRNLGADSGDPTTPDNWYKSLGYYYQHGRNIPFIMDKERWLASAEIGDNDIDNLDIYKSGIPNNTTRLWVMKIDGVPVPASGWIYADKSNDPKMFYTYDYNGNKVYGANRFIIDDSILPSFIPVRSPGEKPQKWSGGVLVDAPENNSLAYKFSIGVNKNEYLNSYTGKVQTWYAPSAKVTTMWSDKNEQPCPPGWRLPTKKDLQSFMPPINFTQTIGWTTVPWPRKYTNQLGYFGYETTTINIGGVNHSTRIYRSQHIINHGQPDAYRVQIESRLVPGCLNKRYIHVARFPVTDPNKYIDGYDKVADWLPEDIIEEMFFPASGGIVSDDSTGSSSYMNPTHPELRWFGTGTVLRTSETDGGLATCDVCYMATTDFNLAITRSSRRVLGCQIRCVRDVK